MTAETEPQHADCTTDLPMDLQATADRLVRETTSSGQPGEPPAEFGHNIRMVVDRRRQIRRAGTSIGLVAVCSLLLLYALTPPSVTKSVVRSDV
ncbi:MAG: hypothetical protein KDA85_21950, partial [Planctomycetaceae bacterium]|nr:hypothetical protein [Planctomycetaceae bacterium]